MRGVVAAAAAVSVVLLAGCGVDGGPLSQPPEHGWATYASVGATFTDGLEVLYLEGDREAVIRNVELVGNDGLELVGAHLAPPGRKLAAIQRIDGWPPLDPDLPETRDAIDATITPTRTGDWKQEQGWNLLVGVRVTEAGYLIRDGIRITYEVGGREYERELPAELVVCTSREMLNRNGDCPFPGE